MKDEPEAEAEASPSAVSTDNPGGVHSAQAATLAAMPNALVLRAAGINCDLETAHAFELAGATATRLHVNRLAKRPELLDDFDLLTIPGGFSHGDDIAAGRILGDRLAREFGDALRRFVDRGGPILGICNGFQVLTQAGLLPGHLDGVEGRACALARNSNAATGGRYACRWVSLTKTSDRCVWTDGLGQDETIELPMAHAEGRIVFKDDRARRATLAGGRVALAYAGSATALPSDFPSNPNGSADAIAGLCDESGLVLGLMPHPERYVDPLQHPAWSRLAADGDAPQPAGLRLFRAAVEHVAGVVA